MARRGFGPASRWQSIDRSSAGTPGKRTGSGTETAPPPGEQTTVEGSLEFVLLSSLKRLPFVGKNDGRTVAELKMSGTTIARLRRPPGTFAALFGEHELHFATTRMRLARRSDRGILKTLRQEVSFFGSMPRRQREWRAGAGTVTRIEENSQDRNTLSGGFRLRDVGYVLKGQQADWHYHFAYTLYDAQGPVATFDPKTGLLSERGWFLEASRPLPVAAIAIASHMAMWLEESVGGSGGAGGGGGPGGGGGGGC